MSATRVATATEYCGNYSNSTEICPYCRSFRGVFHETYRKFKTCSPQLQQSTHHRNTNSKMSDNSTLSYSNTNSHLQKSLQETVGYLKPSYAEVCRCAKNTRIPSSTTTNYTRATFCSSTDGWKAVHLVILGILVLLPTSTMSSPVNHSQRPGSPHSSGHRSHHDKPMKWINPCRIPKHLPTQPSEIQMPSQSDEEIFQNIVTQAKKAEVQARQFFNDFRDECFGETGHAFEQLHLDWLKDIDEKVGKDLGEPVGQERLETLEVEDILKSMYRGLQKLAVGLEQVVLDQAFHGGSFYQHFHEAEFQLKYVLCEFQIAMMEKNIQYEDVTRDIMDKGFVNLEDKTWRNVRDFTIFRDYLNTLEFIKESFEHFWRQSKQAS